MAKKKQTDTAAEKQSAATRKGGGTRSTGGAKKSGTAGAPTAKKSGGAKKSSAPKRNAAAKKPAAKKSAAASASASDESATRAVVTRESSSQQGGQSVPEETPHRREVLDEIVSIAKGLEDDGLELLLEQAKVVEYKGKIEKFNRRLNVAAREAIAARQEAGRPDYHVTIERTEDDFFIIQLDDQRVFFNRGEMRELTRICHKAKDRNAGARNLFKWFERERSDLLADAGINSNRSPYLQNLYEVIVSTYKVRE